MVRIVCVVQDVLILTSKRSFNSKIIFICTDCTVFVPLDDIFFVVPFFCARFAIWKPFYWNRIQIESSAIAHESLLHSWEMNDELVYITFNHYAYPHSQELIAWWWIQLASRAANTNDVSISFRVCFFCFFCSYSSSYSFDTASCAPEIQSHANGVLLAIQSICVIFARFSATLLLFIRKKQCARETLLPNQSQLNK